MNTPLERIIAARAELRALPGAVSVDLIQDDDRLNRHVLEVVVVGPDYERVPPSVLRVLARNDLGIHDVSTRGEPMHFVVLAT